ncbi:MAG: hypothetical protein VSS75_029165 [Candidatus Parabeggiatoa sp.]|nr:hypothetical protein [Candidatus Parabeggiatoa sp.]
MIETQAIEIIRHELLDETGMLVQLNLKNGLDKNAVTRLEEAILFLTKLYANKNYIPKIVAGALFNISADFERCLSFYSESEQDDIFDLKEKLVDMSMDLFGIE